MSESTELTKLEDGKGLSAFSNMKSFENAQRMATTLSKSDIVPKAYQNNIPNTIVALEIAHRIGISPIMVMQNLDIIQGKPSWRSSFIISALNSCGRFKPMRFEFEGEEGVDDFGCRATTFDTDSGEKIKGPKVDWAMVKAEGWLNKNGSKWKTMPELMFQYRAASFFGRLYAPDILTGMHSVEEIIDISPTKMGDEMNEQKLKEITELYDNNDFLITEDERIQIERIIKNKEVLSYDKLLENLNDKIIKTEDNG